jgi:hypothetical protein
VGAAGSRSSGFPSGGLAQSRRVTPGREV